MAHTKLDSLTTSLVSKSRALSRRGRQRAARVCGLGLRGVVGRRRRFHVRAAQLGAQPRPRVRVRHWRALHCRPAARHAARRAHLQRAGADGQRGGQRAPRPSSQHAAHRSTAPRCHPVHSPVTAALPSWQTLGSILATCVVDSGLPVGQQIKVKTATRRSTAPPTPFPPRADSAAARRPAATLCRTTAS